MPARNCKTGASSAGCIVIRGGLAQKFTYTMPAVRLYTRGRIIGPCTESAHAWELSRRPLIDPCARRRPGPTIASYCWCAGTGHAWHGEQRCMLTCMDGDSPRMQCHPFLCTRTYRLGACSTSFAGRGGVRACRPRTWDRRIVARAPEHGHGTATNASFVSCL
jgi:hypothetical protein